jgi:hypothetical protein
MTSKPSAPPTPRPPETTIAASVSSGGHPFSSVTRSTIFAAVAEALSATVTSLRAPAAGAASGAVELGRTVMIGVPLVTFDCTMVEPPKIDCVATRSALTPTASVITPLSGLDRQRPAISLPSAVEVMSTAAGDFSVTSCASSSAFGATTCPVRSAASAT